MVTSIRFETEYATFPSGIRTSRESWGDSDIERTSRGPLFSPGTIGGVVADAEGDLDPGGPGLGRVKVGAEGKWDKWAPYIAEAFGTFWLSFTFLCNLSHGNDMWALSSNAFMVTAMTNSLLHVSGANLNPSVTIALWVCGRHEFQEAFFLCLFQVLGGVVAAAMRVCLNDTNVVHISFGPKPGFGAFEAMLTEVLFTAMICFVFLNCVSSQHNNPVTKPNGFSGLAVGCCYVAGGYASARVSGTVMNPAISIGVQIMDLFSLNPDGWAAIYLIPELIAAWLSVSFYRVVRPREFQSSQSSARKGDQLALLPHHDMVAVDNPISARLMAEMIGTFYVVLTKSMSHVGNSPSEGWCVAAGLTSLVYSLRGVSGAYLNPAVSLAAAWLSGPSGYMPWRLAFAQIGAQFFGAVNATTVLAMIHYGTEIPVRPDHDWPEIAVVAGEVTFTCIFCYVMLAMTPPCAGGLRSATTNIAGVSVGFCFAAASLAIGNISGSVLNPAVAISFTGINLIGGHARVETIFYIAYEVTGAMLAAACFSLTHGVVAEGRAIDAKLTRAESMPVFMPPYGRRGSIERKSVLQMPTPGLHYPDAHAGDAESQDTDD